MYRLPQSWVQTSLGAIVDVLDRLRVPVNSGERAVRSGDVPYYGATGQVGWIDDHLFDEELVLLGEDGAPFLDPLKSKAYIVRGKSWVNNHAHVLRAKSGVLNAFLMYQLNQMDFGPFVSGTTRLKLPQAPMLIMPVAIPPTSEQRRIVEEIEKQFTRLDAAVSALARARTNLKRYRAAVLKAACEGRLVPTEADLARAEGREYEPAERLLERAVVKRGPLKGDLSIRTGYPNAELALGVEVLPAGWTWTTLVAIAEIKGGITKGQRRRQHEHVRLVPYLRVANVQRGLLDLSDVKHIEATAEEVAQLRLQPGDVLFNEGGDRDKLGRGWVWQGQIEECIHQNHVFRARLRSVDIQPKFISWYGNTFGQRYFLDEGKQTTNLASINMRKLGALPLPLPPAAEQCRIVQEGERRLSVVDELEAEIGANLKRAERMRQAILTRAFQGKLVPQDPDDEPASALLERIRAERTASTPAARRASPKHMGTVPRAGRKAKQPDVAAPRLF